MTKATQGYKALRDFIFRNQFIPGERIYLETLSEKLNISFTPLREALNRLIQEGLICHDSGRGYILRVITATEIQHLYELCEALETYSIERTVRRITPSDLNDLSENLLRYKQSIEAGLPRERLAINFEFHLKIVKLSGNELIFQRLNRAFEMIAWKWKLENIMLGRGPEAYGEHLAIYNSLKEGDPAGASAHLQSHIAKTKNAVLRILREKESLFDPDAVEFREEVRRG